MKALLLGLGNELYGDDGVGLFVVQKIKAGLQEKKKKPFWAEDTDFEACSLSGLSLLEVLAGYDMLVIIDTIKRENPVTGKIHVLEEKDLRAVPGPSPHYISVPQTLEIGRKLGLKVPGEIKVVAVEAKNIYRLGEGLTPEMAAAVPEIIRRIKKILRGRRALMKKESPPILEKTR